MVSNKDSVYIILVNYNGCDDTIECINSILKCNYENYEVCVVDNGSTDESANNLRIRYTDSQEPVHLILSNENLGFSGGNNLGITYALERGAEYILLLNNDTIVTSNFLEELVDSSKRYGDKIAVGAKIYYESSHNNANGCIIWYAGGKFNFKTGRSKHYGIDEIDRGQLDKEQEVSFITGCCILLHKDIIKKIGLMPEDYFLYCEDLAYSIEVQRAGFKLIYNPNAVIYHKVSSSTGRNSKISVYYSVRNKLYIIRKYTNTPLLANMVFLFENIKRIICGTYDVKSVYSGYKDYCKGNVGQMK